jgi:ribA/ribD-fused uncharacterized protein
MAEPPEVIAEFRGAYRYLSNPTPCRLVFGGEAWPSVEHAFQAFKTRDRAARERIRYMPRWQDAKAAGRAVELRDDWEVIKRRVMLDLLIGKFAQNPALAAKLAATGNAALEEGNSWHDWYWGICRCGQDACQAGGYNYLGRLLMAVRTTHAPEGPGL